MIQNSLLLDSSTFFPLWQVVPSGGNYPVPTSQDLQKLLDCHATTSKNFGTFLFEAFQIQNTIKCVQYHLKS